MATVRFRGKIRKEKNKELESLMKECGIQTKEDLCNNALTFFKSAVDMRKMGRKIVALDPESGHYTELQMPALSAVGKSK